MAVFELLEGRIARRSSAISSREPLQQRAESSDCSSYSTVERGTVGTNKYVLKHQNTTFLHGHQAVDPVFFVVDL